MKRIVQLGLLGLLILACHSPQKKSTGDEICGLATPINFAGDTLRFFVADYLTDINNLKEVKFPEGIIARKLQEEGVYELMKMDDLEPLSIIELITTDNKYDLLVKNFSREEIFINVQDKNYDQVRVRGNLNLWNARLSTMHKTDTGWTEVFRLPPGEYQYLVVIDGKEQRDPSNPDSVDNNIGGYNSLLRVGDYKQENLPFIASQTADEAKLTFRSTMELDKVYAFWQNQQIEVKAEDDPIILIIPGDAAGMERSFIRLIGCNRQGISNNVLIPLEKGRVIRNASHLNRNDRQTMILYFMMVDRFKDGDLSNNKKVDDPEILPKANYYGGDLAGILEVLKSGYFESLGVNSIWISPIAQNPEKAYGQFPEPRTKFSGYHGYWPVSSTKIDYRYGTEGELKSLVAEVHSRGMNILLDYVANHVHELHPVYREHPEWATSLYLPDGSLNTEKWEEYRLTTWFDTFLPTLDLRKPEVVDPMTDSALYWITEFGLDGFRHDATKHIDELYWRTLTHKIKRASGCDPMPYQIGETYGSPELIASYISSGMLDAQFDFNVYDNAVAAFARDEESFERVQSTLNESMRYYGYHHLMGNITGNQDKPRFTSLAGGDLAFTEDSKYAGWTREIGVGDPIGYEKLKMFHAFNMTIPGIPTIYYGDEIGLPGANDPDNRRWMKFENLSPEEQGVRDIVAKLAHFRINSMPLLYGDLKFVMLTPSSWVFLRSYFDQKVFVIFNKADHPQLVSFSYMGANAQNLKTFQGNNFTAEDDKITLTLPACSFEIITTK